VGLVIERARVSRRGAGSTFTELFRRSPVGPPGDRGHGDRGQYPEQSGSPRKGGGLCGHVTAEIAKVRSADRFHPLHLTVRYGGRGHELLGRIGRCHTRHGQSDTEEQTWKETPEHFGGRL
jgi:hypothetical protein